MGLFCLSPSTSLSFVNVFNENFILLKVTREKPSKFLLRFFKLIIFFMISTKKILCFYLLGILLFNMCTYNKISA